MYATFQSTRPARGATAKLLKTPLPLVFQSTRPARGATNTHIAINKPFINFNPRAPRGARPLGVEQNSIEFCISIHAPREGRDINKKPANAKDKFQSTRPARGATTPLRICRKLLLIFQSTRPARGATAKVNKFLRTFLQKRHGFQIFLRKTLPFKAFCRLQIGKNFSICGANRCGNFCELVLRTIRSSVPRADTSACSRSVRFYSRTSCPSSKIEGCPFLGQ